MSDLKNLKKLLNKLEDAGKNPTPIRRPPEVTGGQWVIAIRTNDGVIQYSFSKKKWIILSEDKFPKSESEK